MTYTAPPTFEPVDPAAAAAQLLLRYLWTYGPATSTSYAKFHAAPAAWASRTFDSLAEGGQIVEVDLEAPAWLAHDDLEFGEAPESGLRLLPYFDTLAIAAWPRERFFPGRASERALSRGQAGNFPVLVVDGVVGGVWHQRRSGRRVRVTVEPLVRLSRRRRSELEAEVDHIAQLQGLRPELTIGEITTGPHA